jgi:hypothetical protein
VNVGTTVRLPGEAIYGSFGDDMPETKRLQQLGRPTLVVARLDMSDTGPNCAATTRTICSVLSSGVNSVCVTPPQVFIIGRAGDGGWRLGLPAGVWAFSASAAGGCRCLQDPNRIHLIVLGGDIVTDRRDGPSSVTAVRSPFRSPMTVHTPEDRP